MHILAATTLILATLSLSVSQNTDCIPQDNCSPPDCRCWNDEDIPGGLTAAETPQVVLVTFEYAINAANVDLYTELFNGVVNPNSCPAVGTFFVQQTNSELGVVKGLHDAGHEIGVTSQDGTLPATEEEWRGEFAAVKTALVGAGVQEQGIVGVRAPQLTPGGVLEFTALAQENFLYDASCSTASFDDQSSFLWPYTYDFAPGPSCDAGAGPEAEFPGKWQVLIADLEFNGTKCATPSACIEVASQQDTFDLFYNSFIQHYEGNRAPFVIVMNPDFVTVDFKRAGAKEFIEYVRAAFDDTWVVSIRQSLEWMRTPVNNANATSGYVPWACA